MSDLHGAIACLGWGSLVWDPRSLPIRKPWFNDGPLLPVEFAGQSRDGRVTLVSVPEDRARVAWVRVLWALMAVDGLDTAIERLGDREGIPRKNHAKYVGRWCLEASSGGDCSWIIGMWARDKGVEGVVWTALSPKFETVDEVCSYLSKLSHEDYAKWKCAEEYVRKAPRQIDTEYRRRLEREYGWTPLSEA
jgi:hypothetical protein